mmetsp:Transcript_18774/g.26170  ORF Transcript_18774/g.26170 Transcript_18774/m.26170 type:complete len:432 (+) Transcript_18774:77-1372(+)
MTYTGERISRPKRARNAFNFFQLYAHTRLQNHQFHQAKSCHTQRISRIISEIWGQMTHREKKAFQQMASEDQARYELENKRYLETMRKNLATRQIKKQRRRRKDAAGTKPAEVVFPALESDPFSKERLQSLEVNLVAGLFQDATDKTAAPILKAATPSSTKRNSAEMSAVKSSVSNKKRKAVIPGFVEGPFPAALLKEESAVPFRSINYQDAVRNFPLNPVGTFQSVPSRHLAFGNTNRVKESVQNSNNRANVTTENFDKAKCFFVSKIISAGEEKRSHIATRLHCQPTQFKFNYSTAKSHDNRQVHEYTSPNSQCGSPESASNQSSVFQRTTLPKELATAFKSKTETPEKVQPAVPIVTVGSENPGENEFKVSITSDSNSESELRKEAVNELAGSPNAKHETLQQPCLELPFNCRCDASCSCGDCSIFFF